MRCFWRRVVDLEHNQYRSFQGLTCLMQISTRTEDYIVDTFKLRVHIGPYLREIFKDPKKRKVMHGADRDIVWLQRDFGIYVCNLFDTGQASRVLNLERNSLEFLLQHFCGVTANKEYQNADWRIRPLPKEMTRYAREDTHYLLYIYDVMRLELQRVAKADHQTDSPLLENVILLDDGGGKEVDAEDEPMSLSELSTNFQKCFNSMSKSNNKAQKPEFLNVEPFDYEAARKEVTFGEGQKGRQGGKKEGGSKAGGQKKGSAPEQSEFGQGKRRQAFPASGNRSATFKS
ncbi:hypothetical protein F2Q68_00044568 [Brassica cretica]|uniref:3'-5' exonuclease domain-containing protein n=1 Tax=Brassica cretica TaxID=69181 RepID=A0A8S9LQ66_BRACR|nr:hypothetical protein F2Q68_00044568 [Brassica cretica]